MKLVIQIPCLNEADNLPIALKDLPKELPGIDTIEWLIIDDGSTDSTVEVAKAHGVNHIVTLPYNQGLAKAFMAGIEASLKAGADIIVNTDADNQYDASYIGALIAPILANQAQIVVGERPISNIEHFSFTKKLLQKLGSWVVKLASKTDIPDAPSGFRAISRNAAMSLYVFNPYTYTIETIIQAGRKGIPITSVPVKVNGFLRPSRLISSIPSYISRSMGTIFRILILYKPLKFFSFIAIALALPGFIAVTRFLVFYLSGSGDGHIQSLIIAAALLMVAAVTFIGGIVADLNAANRILLEEIRARALRNDIRLSEEN